MTRIAYVCADAGIPVFGTKGASVHVQEVIRALRRAGAQVELFATRFDAPAPPDLADLPLHALPAVPAGTPESRADAALQANAGLRHALSSAGSFDLVYERYSLWSWAGMAQARATGTPGLLEVNAPLIDEQARHRVLARPEQAARVARCAFHDAAALVAVSPGVASYLESFPEAAGRVHVVDNGVDPTRFASAVQQVRARRLRAHEGDEVVIGFLGTLKPWHGLPVLATAFGRLVREQGVSARLRIVGDGPERGALHERLAGQGLADRIDWTGAVDPSQVPGELARMDIATAPYAEAAGFYFSPLKLYEYMAAGVPVVCSRVGHLGRWLHDGDNALLVPPDDPDALAGALARLAREPVLRARLADGARAQVVRDHTWDAVATRVLALAEQSRRLGRLPAPPVPARQRGIGRPA